MTTESIFPSNDQMHLHIVPEAHQEQTTDPLRAAVIDEMGSNPQFAGLVSILATNPGLQEYALPRLTEMYGEYFFGRTKADTLPDDTTSATTSIPAPTIWTRIKTKWEEGGLPDVDLPPIPAHERSWASQQSTRTYCKGTNLEITLPRQRGSAKERDDSEQSEFPAIMDATLRGIDHYAEEYACYVTELTESFVKWILDPNELPQQAKDKGLQLLTQFREEGIPKIVDETGKMTAEGKKLADELLRTIRYQIALLPVRSEAVIDAVNSNPSRSYKAAAALVITASLMLSVTNTEHNDTVPAPAPVTADSVEPELLNEEVRPAGSTILQRDNRISLTGLFSNGGTNNG